MTPKEKGSLRRSILRERYHKISMLSFAEIESTLTQKAGKAGQTVSSIKNCTDQSDDKDKI